jgi:hypothetical protein
MPKKPKGKPEQKPEQVQPTAIPVTPKKMGRPTKYDPALCEKVIEWGAAGKSRTWMCAEIGIDRSTIDEWAKVHEDFSLALARAKVLEQRWWEDVGQNGLTDKSFQGSLWSRSMAARFPHEWRETANVNHGVQDSLGDLLSSIDGKSRGIPTARS